MHRPATRQISEPLGEIWDQRIRGLIGAVIFDNTANLIPEPSAEIRLKRVGCLGGLDVAHTFSLEAEIGTRQT